MRREWAGLLLALAAAGVGAQPTPAKPQSQESEAPTPPALQLDRLIPVDVPRASLRYGIDPASVSVGPDGIVRYVVVATSASGAVNAIYEGVRCGTAEVKVYARHNPDSGWSPVREPAWQPLHGNASRHSLLIARGGVCQGHAANGPPEQIVRDLGASPDRRFRGELR
ncbi:CNP1-like family protein [Ramlibacter tataouinensis]|uniref:CNP1-like uncharacterized domain-containing protein n=1 Tax=Ramlibacter tataouinensis (strain ATCC BAA-407 / DSM 14655 / LMG 21543 / TTB310) TaxID=365046 RepID=F5Y6D7_RAMTT|nr:CNP1-like family protein [Ramlibacter tataouinensis]AEG94011.1 hypothetical protein Rta_29080 [Ramlibacter tataouinensis TTB310]